MNKYLEGILFGVVFLLGLIIGITSIFLIYDINCSFIHGDQSDLIGTWTMDYDGVNNIEIIFFENGSYYASEIGTYYVNGDIAVITMDDNTHVVEFSFINNYNKLFLEFNDGSGWILNRI